jgi:inner membrane protease subunit 1
MKPWMWTAIRAGTAAFCLKTYVGTCQLGIGPSMHPTIPDGSIILVNRLSMRWRPLSTGDVIVAQSPIKPQSSMCKRIIAMVF